MGMQFLIKVTEYHYSKRSLFSEPEQICLGRYYHIPNVRVCISVNGMKKKLTLAITSKPEVIELSYCLCVFLATRPFTWQHSFTPCDLDLEVLSTFEKL